jgi:hypothetical protein
LGNVYNIDIPITPPEWHGCRDILMENWRPSIWDSYRSLAYICPSHGSHCSFLLVDMKLRDISATGFGYEHSARSIRQTWQHEGPLLNRNGKKALRKALETGRSNKFRTLHQEGKFFKIVERRLQAACNEDRKCITAELEVARIGKVKNIPSPIPLGLPLYSPTTYIKAVTANL